MEEGNKKVQKVWFYKNIWENYKRYYIFVESVDMNGRLRNDKRNI